MILLHSVSKQYRRTGKRVLDDISVSFPSRSRIAILGPRDSGKTTLLKLLCGLETPTEGWIERRMSVSFPVGSNIRTPQKTTVEQFLGFAARVHTIHLDDLISFIMRSTRMNPDLRRLISDLSKVERKRLNFALGYALPFDCYLFDETFDGGSKSDSGLFAQLFEMRSANAATIFATSLPQRLRQYCNDATHVYLLHNRKLFYCADCEEAITMLKTLPESSETGARARPAANSDGDWDGESDGD